MEQVTSGAYSAYPSSRIIACYYRAARPRLRNINLELSGAAASDADDCRNFGRQRGDRLQTTMQMLWADELLENQSQMQADLLASADLFVRGKRRGVLI